VPVETIAKVDLPLLVIHAEEDRLSPVEFGRRMFEASRSPQKTWCPVAGAGTTAWC